MNAIEMSIRNAYVEFNAAHRSPVSSDEILCDPKLEDQFWDFAAKRDPKVGQLERPEKNRLLLRMRKRGSDNDGLPRYSK
jgi:hypothetical protein